MKERKSLACRCRDSLGEDRHAMCGAGAVKAGHAGAEEDMAASAGSEETLLTLQAELAGQQKRAAYKRMLACLQVLVLLLLVLSELYM